MAKNVKPPAPKTGSPSEDLIPRSMLPESSVIPEWRQFGYGATTPAAPSAPKPAPKKGGKYKGGAIKKMAGGGKAPNPNYGRSPTQPYDKRKYVNFPGGRSDKDIATPVIPDPVKYPEYIEEVGEERVSGPRMRKGGMVKSSASKRADGIAQRGKTKGRFV